MHVYQLVSAKDPRYTFEHDGERYIITFESLNLTKVGMEVIEPYVRANRPDLLDKVDYYRHVIDVLKPKEVEARNNAADDEDMPDTPMFYFKATRCEREILMSIKGNLPVTPYGRFY